MSRFRVGLRALRESQETTNSWQARFPYIFLSGGFERRLGRLLRIVRGGRSTGFDLDAARLASLLSQRNRHFENAVLKLSFGLIHIGAVGKRDDAIEAPVAYLRAMNATLLRITLE